MFAVFGFGGGGGGSGVPPAFAGFAFGGTGGGGGGGGSGVPPAFAGFAFSATGGGSGGVPPAFAGFAFGVQEEEVVVEFLQHLQALLSEDCQNLLSVVHCCCFAIYVMVTSSCFES